MDSKSISKKIMVKTMAPDKKDVDGFDKFVEYYKKVV